MLADTCLKLAGESDLPAYEVVAFVGLAVMVTLLASALWRNQVGTLWPRDPLRQFLRACLDLVNNVGVFIALRYLPLALFYILIFSAPIVTILLAAVLLGEKLEWKKTIAISTGFLGVVVAINPFALTLHKDWIGYLACACCVCAFSLNMVWSRVLTQTETPESLTFFSGALRVLVGGTAMLYHATPIKASFATVLSASGVFLVVGSLCFFKALKYARVATVSQYHYSQLLLGALLGYFIWHEKLTSSMVAGAVLIIASSCYMGATAYNKREELQLVIRNAA